MALKYLVEEYSDGSVMKWLPDYEFNYLVYEPRKEYEAGPKGKFMARRECYAIRMMENRWARPVLMEDGKWVAYASYLRKDE